MTDPHTSRITRLCYIAQPFQSEIPAIMRSRALAGSEAAAYLMTKEVPYYCPIGGTAHIAEIAQRRYGRTAPHDYFLRGDITILASCCSMMAVLRLPGWEKSKGLREELALCERLSIPVMDVRCDDRDPALMTRGLREETIADLDAVAAKWRELDTAERAPHNARVKA